MPLISAQTEKLSSILVQMTTDHLPLFGKLTAGLLVMLLLADVDERPAFSTLPRCAALLAGGQMSTTIPTALLGSAGRGRVGDVDR